MNKPCNIAFFLRAYNDLDHITPVIWKCLSIGEDVVVVFLSELNYQKDYRIIFLKNTFKERINIFRYIDDDSGFFKIASRIKNNHVNIATFLRSNNVVASVFEWGAGIPRISGVKRLVKMFGLGSIREKFLISSKKIGIPCFCLPHGLNVYINKNINQHIDELIKTTGNYPDFSDRNVFDYYVFQSQYHRETCIDWGLNRNNYVWGSARFFPQWAKLNLELCGDFITAKDDSNMLKVVFMLPHWIYNVDRETCLLLLSKISKIPWVYLVIKDHTRGSGGLSDKERNEFNSKKNVEASVEAHSPALINWADVVINFGSSIGIEALLQDKILFNPKYLHSNTTIFDKTQACITLNSNDEVIQALNNFKDGGNFEIEANNKELLYKEVIFGGQTEFDVLSYYCERIKSKIGEKIGTASE